MICLSWPSKGKNKESKRHESSTTVYLALFLGRCLAKSLSRNDKATAIVWPQFKAVLFAEGEVDIQERRGNYYTWYQMSLTNQPSKNPSIFMNSVNIRKDFRANCDKLL